MAYSCNNLWLEWPIGERRASSPRANSDGSLPAADPYAAHRSGACLTPCPSFLALHLLKGRDLP